MCIYSCVMIITQSTTVLITRGPVQWRGQLVIHHVYIMYIYLHHVHVYIMYVTHHKLTAPLNWTARNQYSCRPVLNDNHYTRINTHIY